MHIKSMKIIIGFVFTVTAFQVAGQFQVELKTRERSGVKKFNTFL